jgi:hypothetical protein
MNRNRRQRTETESVGEEEKMKSQRGVKGRGRDGGRDGWREGGREGWWERGREGGRETGKRRGSVVLLLIVYDTSFIPSARRSGSAWARTSAFMSSCGVRVPASPASAIDARVSSRNSCSIVSEPEKQECGSRMGCVSET